MDPPQVSLIIPALNEAENLPPLAEQIDQAMRGRSYEILVVDDNSRDQTPQVAARLAERFPLRLIVRTEPKDGLSGAVLHGMAQARGEIFVVMDADLQHPPSRLPELIGPIESGQAEFVLGSRYMPGGSMGEKWGFLRKLNSRVATLLARPFAGAVSDPMSGFFALRRNVYQRGRRLTPLGYKIGLELIAKCRVKEVREIPIHFAERTRGQSKLTLREQIRYLEHLSRLYDFYFPRLSPIIKFLIVTAVSWFAALAVFLSMLSWTRINPAGATGLAYLAAILVTALFHARYVRTQREFLVRPHPWLDFLLASLAEWITCCLTALYIARRVERPSYWELFVIPFSVALLTRYVLRKELLLDIRGLRRLHREHEID